LILFSLIAKGLGASEYGVWVQINVTLALLVPVVMLRLESAAIRYLSSKTGKAVGEDFFSMLLLIWIFLFCTSGIGLLFERQVANFLFGDFTKISYIRLFFLSLIVNTTFDFLLKFYRAFDKIKKYSVIELIVSFFSMGVAASGIISGKDLSWILTSVILVHAVASLLIIIDILHQTAGIPRRVNGANLHFYLRYTIPLIPNSLLLWVINSSDRYFIAHMLDIKQVGIYSASYTLGHFTTFLLTPIAFTLFPVVSKLWEQGNLSEVKRYMRNSIRYYLLICTPSIVGIYYAAPVFLRKLASQEFVTSRYLILFITLGFFCVGIYNIYLYVIHLREQTKYLPLVFLSVALLNVVLNIFLIPQIGILGAAFSTFLAYLFQMIIIMVFSAKLFWIGFDLNLFAKSIISSLGMLYILHFFSPNDMRTTLLAVLVGATAYVIFMILLKGIGRKEWEMGKLLLANRGKYT
jgi:O-antigen/teichoic acid export membrane protein